MYYVHCPSQKVFAWIFFRALCRIWLVAPVLYTVFVSVVLTPMSKILCVVPQGHATSWYICMCYIYVYTKINTCLLECIHVLIGMYKLQQQIQLNNRYHSCYMLRMKTANLLRSNLLR